MGDGFRVACPRCGTRNVVPSWRLADRPRCGRCAQPLLGGAPAVLTEGNREAHLGVSDLLSVVWACAPWSEACETLAPDLEAAAEALAEECRVAILDVEAEPRAAAALGVRAVPSAILFRGGREAARREGPLGTEALVAWVRGLLAPS